MATYIESLADTSTSSDTTGRSKSGPSVVNVTGPDQREVPCSNGDKLSKNLPPQALVDAGSAAPVSTVAIRANIQIKGG